MRKTAEDIALRYVELHRNFAGGTLDLAASIRKYDLAPHKRRDRGHGDNGSLRSTIRILDNGVPIRGAIRCTTVDIRSFPGQHANGAGGLGNALGRFRDHGVSHCALVTGLSLIALAGVGYSMHTRRAAAYNNQ